VEHFYAPSNISSRPTHLSLRMIAEYAWHFGFFEGSPSDGSHVRDTRDGLRQATRIAPAMGRSGGDQLSGRRQCPD
jgi:hypothetical protein